MSYTKIKMADLQEGDIFADEIKLKGREAFLVDNISEKMITCISRTTNKSVKKAKKGHVFLLRKHNNGK